MADHEEFCKIQACLRQIITSSYLKLINLPHGSFSKVLNQFADGDDKANIVQDHHQPDPWISILVISKAENHHCIQQLKGEKPLVLIMY